jgi:kynurenine formamidase
VTSRTNPDGEEVRGWLAQRRNWGRWGPDDGVGAVNLISPEKRVEAVGLVRTGRTVSLSRPVPVRATLENPKPALHYNVRLPRDGHPGAGSVTDFIGMDYHGLATTHIDALSHVWDEHGVWNGREPEEVIGSTGVEFADVDCWKDGIFTRGILLDVPAYRGTEFVDLDCPVHGWELQEIVESLGLDPQPGDAVVVHCGREAWDRARPTTSWGSAGKFDDRPLERAGLSASCLEPLSRWDCAVLLWDMMDQVPNAYGLPWAVHGAIHSFGIALVDNSLVEPLAAACAQEGRWEFLLTVLPLRIPGGTGSPVNPVAMF